MNKFYENQIELAFQKMLKTGKVDWLKIEDIQRDVFANHTLTLDKKLEIISETWGLTGRGRA